MLISLQRTEIEYLPFRYFKQKYEFKNVASKEVSRQVLKVEQWALLPIQNWEDTGVHILQNLKLLIKENIYGLQIDYQKALCNDGLV